MMYIVEHGKASLLWVMAYIPPFMGIILGHAHSLGSKSKNKKKIFGSLSYFIHYVYNPI